MILKAFMLITAATILSGCGIEKSLLYYPDSSAPSEAALKADNLQYWPSASDYRGLVSADEENYPNGTIIAFHGNGGTAADRAFYGKVLGAMGYRVILAEYPRYGGRKGELGENAFVADAGETVRLAFMKYGGPLFLLGESLGCGVAAAVAGGAPATIDGVICITPWDTLESVARSKFPFLPVRLLLKDKYDNIGNLGSFKGRIAVVGAERDVVIPMGHARNLYNSLSGTARKMWIIKGAGHNDWPASVNTSWWKELMDFVKGN